MMNGLPVLYFSLLLPNSKEILHIFAKKMVLIKIHDSDVCVFYKVYDFLIEL